MEFIQRVRQFVQQAEPNLQYITNEEATKLALVFPFLQMLGYNTANPAEVMPEFTADVGTKKGEKVDIAIQMNGQPMILIEVKPYGTDLTLHDTQLFRYFTSTSAKFGVLTDGLRYRFFSDLEDKNKMDGHPFFEVNLLDADDSHIAELQRFEKDSFDVDEATSAAAELKYTRRILFGMERELRNPSDQFLTFWLREIGIARVTKARRTELRPVVKRALNQFVTERVNARLQSAMERVGSEQETRHDEMGVTEHSEADEEGLRKAEEQEAFLVLKAILRRVIPVERIHYRETQNYLTITIDPNRLNDICRVYIGKRRKAIELLSQPRERYQFDTVDDLFEFEQPLLAYARELEKNLQPLDEASS